jgi:hypothetical protein
MVIIMRNALILFALSCFIFPLLCLAAEPESLVVFVPQAKLREEPNFQAKVMATVPDGGTVTTTGKIYRAKSGPDHFGIINESWVQVEHNGTLLWVPRRDCIKPAQYLLISTAHNAGIAGDTKGMLAALDSATMLVISPDGENAFAAFDPHLFGVFHSGRGLVEWFSDEMQSARWSPDSRYLVLEVNFGPRNIYDVEKRRAVYAGDSFHFSSGFSEEFVPGFYIYSAPGSELHDLKPDQAGQIYYRPELCVVNLETGDEYLLLEGRKGSEQKLCGAWTMEMERKTKDVPDAVKTSELWQQYDGGLMPCPLLPDREEEIEKMMSGG